MFPICDENLCTGCGACANACQTLCIQMTEDRYGELHPSVDENRCIKCGACKRVCPIYNDQHLTVVNEGIQKCFAAVRKDLDEHIRCASGGIASLIMELALKKGWRVYATELDEKLEVRIAECKSDSDIDRFRGSRYVQSFAGTTFKDIKAALKNKKVLFIGTPCQVAGLKRLCANEIENLYTCDLVCHGVSPYSYLNSEIKRLKYRSITNITFRGVKAKEDHWLTLWNGTKKVYSKYRGRVPYEVGFYMGITLRNSCHSCRFTCTNRPGDLTLGDFLGLKSKSDFFRNNKVTLVLQNSAKGKELLEFIKDDIFIEQRPIEEAVVGGISLREPFPHTEDSLKFREYYVRYGYKKAILKITRKYIIQSYCKAIISKIKGSI